MGGAHNREQQKGHQHNAPSSKPILLASKSF
jgi:hypothetical protein